MADMISKKEFLDKLHNDINFSTEEKRRKSLLFKMILTYITALFLLCIGVYAIIYLFTLKINANISFIFILLLMIICVLIYSYLRIIPSDFYNKYKNKLKDYLIIYMLKELGIKKISCFEYDYCSEIKKSRLFSDFAHAEFDDVIGNNNFIALETKLIHTDEFQGKYGKEEYNTPIFTGLILFFKSNKNIKAKTIVTGKNDKSINNYTSLKGTMKSHISFLFPMYIIIGYIFYLGGKNIFADKFLLSLLPVPILIVIIWSFMMITPAIKRHERNKKYFENLKFEDISFDKRFKVYSENQVEGRYLVTPAFMDRLYNLQTAFGVKDIKCSFYEDKIMFAISSKRDLFELGDLYHTFGENVERFYDEIASIYEMIEYFKLNERTGL